MLSYELIFTVCVCVIDEFNYSMFASLETGDGGQSGMRGRAEHDGDCGRAFIPDDTVQPLYAGQQDYVEIPAGRCKAAATDSPSIDRYCGEVLACSPAAIGTATTQPSTVCSGTTSFIIDRMQFLIYRLSSAMMLPCAL